MSIRIPTVLAFVALSLSTVAIATADPARVPEQVSRSVDLSGIDLSTPAGVAQAEVRIGEAARRLCRKFEDSRRVSSRETFADCVRDTRQASLRQLEQRAPAAFAAARESH